MATKIKYGLTCGFWSDDPKEVDAHVLGNTLSHANVYDLDYSQYREELDTGCKYKQTGSKRKLPKRKGSKS